MSCWYQTDAFHWGVITVQNSCLGINLIHLGSDQVNVHRANTTGGTGAPAEVIGL